MNFYTLYHPLSFISSTKFCEMRMPSTTALLSASLLHLSIFQLFSRLSLLLQCWDWKRLPSLTGSICFALAIGWIWTLQDSDHVNGKTVVEPNSVLWLHLPLCNSDIATTASKRKFLMSFTSGFTSCSKSLQIWTMSFLHFVCGIYFSLSFYLPFYLLREDSCLLYHVPNTPV